MRRIPINTDAEGNAKTIPAGYYKFRFRNLTRKMGGARDGFAATGIMEEYEEDDTDKHDGKRPRGDDTRQLLQDGVQGLHP